MSQRANYCVISSRDRQNFLDSSPSEFTISLQNPIDGFNKITLSQCIMPNSFYNITTKKQNDIFFIDGNEIFIPPGNYNLNQYIDVIKTISHFYVPDLDIIYNQITSTIIFQSTSNFDLNFDLCPGTAFTLGFKPILYTGSNFYKGYITPHITNLGVLMNIDIITGNVSLTNRNVKSCSFYLPNNTNDQEYIQYLENTMFEQSIYTKNLFINSMRITVSDDDGGYILENLGEWSMILRFDRIF